MAKNDLIIDDDYCREMGEYFVSQGEAMDEIIAEYLSILQEIKGAAITSGEVSDALKIYITYVEKLVNHIGNIAESIKKQIEKFITRVDTEDQYIF